MLFSDLLASHFQTFKKGSQIFNSFTRWQPNVVLKTSNHCRKDISQPYFDNICWHFRWVEEKFGDITFDYKNALSAKVQSIYAMNLEEDDFVSWHNILINYLPISHPFFFLFLRSFFLIVSSSFKKVAKVFPYQLMVPTWPRIIKNRWIFEHIGTYIWTKLYLVSYHSFENPPLVSHFDCAKHCSDKFWFLS